MRINTKHKFVFISTPKAGTHTIYKILETHFREGLSLGGDFHCNRITGKPREWFRWTCVRNPYSRVVSLWWSTCRCHSPDIYGAIRGCGAQDDFNKFVAWLAATTKDQRKREPLLMNQADWLSPVMPIYVVHIEQLQEELATLPFWKSGIEVPRLNTSSQKIRAQSEEEGREIPRPSWQELCSDPGIQQVIQTWAQRDFEIFGYSKDVP